MSTDQISRVEAKFKGALSEQALNDIGRQTGFAERMRDITPHRLALAMIATFSSSNAETLADIQRKFTLLTGIPVSYKPFHNQLSKAEFGEFMRKVLCHALGLLTQTVLRPMPGSALRQFDDILLQDGSSFGIKDVLAELYPGRFSKHTPAAVELHATMSIFQDCIARVTLAPDTQGERDFLPEPGSLSRKLILADRGYEDRDYFARVKLAGGGFVIRCKANANPLVKACWLADGKVRQFSGKKLKLFRAKLAGQDADLEVEHTVDGQTVSYRMVLIWNPIHQSHMILATSLDPLDFPPFVVRSIYAVRWQVELAFKEWKSYANLRKFNTGKAPIVQGLIWASLTAALLKRFLAHSAQVVHNVATSTRKAAMCLGDHVLLLLSSMVKKRDATPDISSVLTYLAKCARRFDLAQEQEDGRLVAGLEVVIRGPQNV